MTDDITDISGIGPKTEKKLRKRLRKNRPTSRAGEKVSVTDINRNQVIAKSILAADQQRALKDAGSRIKLDRDARKKEAAASREKARQESDTIRRGDFRVGKDEIREAQDRFEDLPDDRREKDKNSRDPVVTDLDVWQNNISRFDFPGVDTPSNRRVRTDDTDIALNDTTGLTVPRETFQNSKPEPDEAQRELGITPKGADAERTGLVRAKDGEFVERPLRPTDGGAYRSANGQTVTGGLQDPTIGRDPDDGEFVDLPAGGEPAVPLPDSGNGGGMGVSLTSEDRSVLETLARSNMASGGRAERIEEARLSDDPSTEAREAVVETGESILNFRDEIESPKRTDTDFISSDDLDRIDSVVSKFQGGR
jgi:hypothetical protein